MTNYPRNADLPAQLAAMEKRLYSLERRTTAIANASDTVGWYTTANGATATGWRLDNRLGRANLPNYTRAEDASWIELVADGGFQATEDGIWIVHTAVRFNVNTSTLGTVGISSSSVTVPDSTFPYQRWDLIGVTNLLQGTFTFPVTAGQTFYRWAYNNLSSNLTGSAALVNAYQTYTIVTKV